ncbi:MAG: DUF2779 domain-containing protein [Spirochaetaceae bacterium]
MSTVLSNRQFRMGLWCARELWYAIQGDGSTPDSDGGIPTGSDPSSGILTGPKLYEAFERDQQARLEHVVAQNGPATDVFSPQSTPITRSHRISDSLVASARAEGLEESEKGRVLYLVRPATGVKEAATWEAAFVAYVFTASGLPVEAIKLLHVNKSYRHEPGDGYVGLVAETDLTMLAHGRATEVGRRLETLSWILTLDEAEMLRQTRPCGRRRCGVCRRDRNGTTGEKASRERLIREEAERSGKAHIEREEIAQFIDSLNYPLRFLDFEAYNEAVPTMRGVGSWEHIPVVYSLHTLDHPEGDLRHTIYASPPGHDDRENLYRHLRSRLGERGSIVVYGRTFERRMLYRLAAANAAPTAGRTSDVAGGVAEGVAAEAEVERLTARLVDLSRIFCGYHFYHPCQQGSASLKAVYAALVDEGYASLGVSDGRDANALYYFLRYGFPAALEVDEGEVLERLKRYCSFDTGAMVAVFRRLCALL